MVSVRFLRPLLTLFILVLLAFLPMVSADRGGWSPIGERVSESGQKAIIAWNGTHEILMLSTDVSSSKESEVVEIMPLPSNPTISKGEKQSFLKVKTLVNTYLAVISSGVTFTRQWGFGGSTAPQITITFQQMIGVHYLTVVRAEEANELIQWLENFLETEGYSKELPSDLESLLSYYVQNGMSFFVIDLIETNSTVRTIDPLVYKFRSQNLYYPLRISTLFSGDTEISLFTITNDVLNDNSITSERFVKKAEFQIKQEALAEISTNVTKLFSCDPYLCYFRYSGSLKVFYGDILTDFQSSSNISTLVLAILSLGLGLVFLLLLLPVNKKGLHLKNIHIPVARRLEIALLFAGLLGIFLIWIGCFLPWGLVGYGENGEVLVALNGVYGTSVPAVTIVVLFVIVLLLTTPWYFYSLIPRNLDRQTSLILTMGGAYTMFQVLISCAYYLYDVDIGVFAILIGCSSILLAGVFSFWRTKRT